MGQRRHRDDGLLHDSIVLHGLGLHDCERGQRKAGRKRTLGCLELDSAGGWTFATAALRNTFLCSDRVNTRAKGQTTRANASTKAMPAAAREQRIRVGRW